VWEIVFKEEGENFFSLGHMVNECFTNIYLTGTTYCFLFNLFWGCMLFCSLSSEVFLFQPPQTFFQAQLRENTRAGDTPVEGQGRTD